MLRLIRLPVELEQMIHEAQARSVRQLLDGWDKELEAHAKALKEQAKKHAAQAARDAAIAASLEVYLLGLVSRAQGGDDQSVSIPSGISVASTIAGGPSIDALHSLADAVGEADDPAQRSAAWALSHGYMPHPSDLGSMLDRLGIDPEWASRLHSIADKMAGADKLFGPHPQLQGRAGLQKLTALKDENRVLDAYGADRLFRLIADPRSLAPIDRGPPQGGPRTRTPAAAIDQAIKHVRSR